MSLTKFLINVRYALRPSKPLLTARLIKTIIGVNLNLIKPLRYVDFSIDPKCNLSCEHCFATVLSDPKRPKLEISDYKRIADEAMKLGAVNFSFQGGEPLLDKRLPEIIKACSPHKNLISLTTNGTLLTEEKIAELKGIGVDILTVSLDSSIPEEHDKFRNKEGTYAKALEAIEEAHRQRLNVTIGTVLTHDTLHSPGLQGLLNKALSLKSIINLIMPVPAGNWLEENSFLLTDEDIQYVDKLTKSSPYIRTDFQANWKDHGCGAAKEILYVTPYGDVLPCPFMHISFGNCNEESIEEIRGKMLDNKYFTNYEQKCLVSTDKEFLTKHLSKTMDAEKLPVHYKEIFKD